MTPNAAERDPERVRRMFDRIAPVYDVMNTLMTAGVDRLWRAAAVRALRLQGGSRALDVATGTGKLACAMAPVVGSHGRVVGLDASSRMLERARRRAEGVDWIRGDAMRLPFDDETFDAVSIGFGLRNLPDIGGGLLEMCRVLRPGGRLVVLELAVPRSGPARLVHRTWFRRLVPLLGKLAGSRAAYAYLPASLEAYPPPAAVADLMRAVGMANVRWRYLRTGMATLHVGTKVGRP